MAKVTSTEFAEKWGRRLSQATEDIRRGVDRVAEAPGAKAARKKDKWVAKITATDTHDKWVRNIAAVPLEEWKTRMKDIGISRIPAGVEAAKGKVSSFGEQLLSYQDSLAGKIAGMPDTTYEQTKARMVAWFDGMSKFRYRK